MASSLAFLVAFFENWSVCKYPESLRLSLLLGWSFGWLFFASKGWLSNGFFGGNRGNHLQTSKNTKIARLCMVIVPMKIHKNIPAIDVGRK